MSKLEPFRWQTRKRPKVSAFEGSISIAFRQENQLEEELFEEQPAPSKQNLHLEDLQAKCERLVNEGSFLAEAGRYAEALQRWDEALNFSDHRHKQAVICEQMAQILLMLEREFEAVRAAAQAVQLDPSWCAAHLTHGRALLNYVEIEQAIGALNRAGELDPNDVSIQMEIKDAEDMRSKAQNLAKQNVDRSTVVNGRMLESRFWESALKVTYDAEGRPTTHYNTGQD